MSNFTVGSIIYGLLHMFAVFGVQNIVAVILLLVCLKSIIVNIYHKEYMKLILPGVVTVYLLYSLFTLSGNLRLLCLQYGHPGVAYTFSGKVIESEEVTTGKIRHFNVTCDTGKTDRDGKKILPEVDVFKLGPLYYSLIWRARV
ncbi:MAG: hypothetical protein IJG59_05200 [Erysipelotrichaceae bacterium]|nr:hypothetical protein [Erysipelotrichaceae bacterium]